MLHTSANLNDYVVLELKIIKMGSGHFVHSYFVHEKKMFFRSQVISFICFLLIVVSFIELKK